MLPDVILDFLLGFSLWLQTLTLQQLALLMLIPFIIDLSRSIGKSLILLIHGLYRKLKPLRFDPTIKPPVSVIIPAHNEEKIIEKSINSAVEMDYGNKEIIVVDDGSTDQTYEKALPYASKGLIKLLRRETASGSKAAAVNYGISFSTGKLIAILDADTQFERKALSEAVKYFSDPNVNAVSGNVRVIGGDHGKRNLLVKFQSYEYLLSLEMGRRYNALVRTLIMIPGAFGIVRRDIITGIGLFDKDTITEDFDMTVKLRKVTGNVLFASDAISWTNVPDRWRDWTRQRVRWAHGQLATLLKHRDALKKQRFSLPFVTALYDMIFMDIILLIMRFIGLVALTYFYWYNILHIIYFFILLFIFYISSELFTALSAAVLSSKKSELKYLILAPLVTLLYRPLYGVVRLKAYLEFLTKKKVQW